MVNILAWEIPWTEEPGGPQSMGSQKSQTQLSDQTTKTTISVSNDSLVKKKKNRKLSAGVPTSVLRTVMATCSLFHAGCVPDEQENSHL